MAFSFVMADHTKGSIVADLTTVTGIKAAASLLEGDLGWVLFPQAKLLKTLADWLGSPSEVSPEKQAEAAERIIAAGRKHGAKKLKLKMDRDAGARLKAAGKLKGEDVGIEGSIGVDGKMELEIEYA